MAGYVGSFNVSSAEGVGTVKQIRGVGYQGKAVLFWWTGRTETADAAGGAHHRRGMGAAVSATSRRAAATRSVDAGGSSDTGRWGREDACVALITTADATDGLLDFSAWDADGFDLVVDDAFTASYRIHFMVLPSDTTDVDLRTCTEPAAAGTVGYAIGFDPLTGGSPAAAAIFFGVNVAGAQVGSTLSVGVAVSSSQQAILANSAADGSATMVAKAYCRSGEVWCNLDTASGPTARAQFDSWQGGGTNQFTLNFTERSSTRPFFALSFKGGRYAVTSTTTRTDTTQWSLTGLGVGTPQLALFGSHNEVQSTADTMQNHDSWSVGAAASASQRVAGATYDEHNTANAEVTTAVEHDQVYVNLSNADAVEGLMDLVSFDSDGMTLVMDDADPAASFVWTLVMGPPAGGGTFGDGAGSSTLEFASAGAANALFDGAGSSTLTFGPTGVGSALADAAGSTTIAFSPAAVGAALADGAGAGAITFSPAGAGSALADGAGASTFTFAPAAGGSSLADAAGASAFTFAAAGVYANESDGAGSSSLTFAAAGDGSSLADAAGASALDFSGSGTGSSLFDGAGSAALAFGGTAAGSALIDAAGSSAVTFTAAAVSQGGAAAGPAGDLVFNVVGTDSYFIFRLL